MMIRNTKGSLLLILPGDLDEPLREIYARDSRSPFRKEPAQIPGPAPGIEYALPPDVTDQFEQCRIEYHSPIPVAVLRVAGIPDVGSSIPAPLYLTTRWMLQPFGCFADIDHRFQGFPAVQPFLNAERLAVFLPRMFACVFSKVQYRMVLPACCTPEGIVIIPCPEATTNLLMPWCTAYAQIILSFPAPRHAVE